ncbi:MAG: tetratricopeptide repeat protein, partial [bacterium]
WAHLSVQVQPNGNAFSVKVLSSSPLSGWILKDSTGGHVLAKGGCAPNPTLQFQVPSAFQSGDRLTLFIDADHEEMPAIMRLTTNPSHSTSETGNSVDAENFQSDPGRPYNKMVETLYDQALADYGQGRTDDALSLLKNAQELDPEQTQVQGLLKKVRADESYSGDKGLSHVSTVDSDVEKDLNPTIDTRSKHKSRAIQKDESIAAYFKTTDTPKISSPKKKRHKKKSKKKVILTETQTEAEADQAYNLGLESYRLGNYADAEKDWEQTLLIDPNHPQAQRDLARLKAEHPELP